MQGISVPLLNPNKLRMNRKPQNDVKHLQDQNVTEVIPLSTPVSVHNLEEILSGHPDKNIFFQSFVTILLAVCTWFTHVVHTFSGATCPQVIKKCASCFR
jgi:hypothetical protein